MDLKILEEKTVRYDERRLLAIPGSQEETLDFCVEHIVEIAKESIESHCFFAFALSGGSTPKAIFSRLSEARNKERIDWKKTYLFWSDERAVPPEDVDSNYRMAMEAGFKKLPIPQQNIFRMRAEVDIEENALTYENLIKAKLAGHCFDLVMLGMGDDGHTASLFPKTEGVKEQKRLVVANFVPQKNTWRMSFTFPLINAARHVAVYVLGDKKAEMVEKVLAAPYDPHTYPVQAVGTKEHPVLWILDSGAARLLKKE